MKQLGLMLCGFLLCLGTAWADELDEFTGRSQQEQGLIGGGLIGPVTPHAYGLGAHADATGQPFHWVPRSGGSARPDPFLEVTPNAYGPGVGMDQYGRAVRPVPGRGSAPIGPCIRIMGACR